MTHYVNKCIYGKINTMSHNIYHFSNPNKFQTKYTWKSNIYRYTKTPIILAKKDHTSINPSLQINKQRGGLGAKNYLINRVWWRGNNGSKSSEGGVYGIIVGCNIRTLSCFHIWSLPQNFTWCYHLFLHFHSSRISLLFPSFSLQISQFTAVRREYKLKLWIGKWKIDGGTGEGYCASKGVAYISRVYMFRTNL